MNEDLRRNPEKAMMLFTKVYVYHTNTKKPWNKLSKKEMNKKSFEWFCQKWFCVSKKPITEEDVKKHLENCPELKESHDDVLKNNKGSSDKWKHKAAWFDVYDNWPLTEYDLKLLLNVIGIRMIHFVNN